MSHSYSSNRIHLIFSTRTARNGFPRNCKPNSGHTWRASPARNHGFEAIKVGGIADHAHAFVLLPPTIPLAKAVQILKSCSSKWINDTGTAGKDFAWQEGVRGLQRERLANGRGHKIHRGPGGAPCEAKL